MSTKLNHGPAKIVATMLYANRALGTDPTWWATHQTDDGTHNWPLGWQAERASPPDRVITVYETTPQQDGRIMVTGEEVKHFGLTIRVRAEDDEIAGQKARDIEYDLTQGFAEQTVTLDGTRYLIIIAKVSVIPALKTQSGSNQLWFVNLNCLAVIKAYPLGG